MRSLGELFRRRTLVILVALALTAVVVSGCFVDSYGIGMAYVDANCNGVKDPDEAPLAGVCVWTSGFAGETTPSPEECAKEYLQTDIEGMGHPVFYSGAACRDVYVFAQAPAGFDPTTDTVVNGCDGEFGFAPTGACPPRRSVTALELAGRERIRCLAWVVGVPGVLVLLALGYRKFRRDTLARHDMGSGE
ncbi:MAG TPA: hypothetical protein VM537_06230 [Anaerolineae bacterium]|nr:hypothetical protein [Anaerolineae bacterium]